MGIGGEETKHDVVSRSSSQQQPLTQQQVLQHLTILQKRMGQMQSFAKGLTDQAQQDKIKIQTLEHQLEAAKTLQWAKQKIGTSPRATVRKEQIGEVPPTTMGQAKTVLPPISTPRLEEIRKFRQEREEKLRHQFSHSSEVNDLAKAISSELDHTHELEDKLHEVQGKYDALQSVNSDLQAENANILLEHTESLAEKQAVISRYEGEIKALEELIEESYHERETLERKLIKTTNKKSSLDIQIERMEETSRVLKKRDEENTLVLMRAHDIEDTLKDRLLNDGLEALAGLEEKEDLIQQMESMIKALEHQLEKASRQEPPQGESGNQMQREQDWGKDVLGLNHKVETLKQQLKDQENDFHNETIEMEVELMDSQEFGRMQREMLEVQEMELLLLSNALADLKKGHPLARSLSGGDLFAIHEGESELDKSLDEDEQPPPPPPPPPLMDESPATEHAMEAAKFKKEKAEKDLQERVRKAHLQSLHCNIYSLSRKFEWQLQRREELQATVEKLVKKYETLTAKYTKSEEELKKLKAGQGNQVDASTPALQEDDGDSTENKESLTRALMRASMSIRTLQQDLKTSKQRTTHLEKELENKVPGEESEGDEVAQLKSQLEEQTETNELLKEFMQDLKSSYEQDREEWNSEQKELNEKIEQLTLELNHKSGSNEESPKVLPPSPPSPSPRSAMDRLESSTPAKNVQEPSRVIASPPKTPLRKEWMTEISVVRSEISRLKRTLQSKQPQNESFLGAMNESGSHHSDDYIFADRSEDEINNEQITPKGNDSTNSSEKWYQEVTALKEELNDLTLELRNSNHHERKAVATPPPVDWKKVPPTPLRTGLDDASSVDSSTTGGFENEILMMRQEVSRQQEQIKSAVSPYSAVSSAGSNASPNQSQVHPAGSSLVSSLEGDSSFTEFAAFSEI